MASVGMNTDITALVDAAVAGNIEQVTGIARDLIEHGSGAAELIGRIGVIASRGDSDGHPVITLAAAAMMSRWSLSLQYLLGEDPQDHRRELPLLVQAVAAAVPAVRAGNATDITYPEPLFPSGLPEGQTVGTMMTKAIFDNDATLVERLLLGLHGTGADYRTIHIRTYDGISTTFQHSGHPLMFAVRGFQLLDSVEWGKSVPPIIHWLAPHIPVHTEEPAWVRTIRDFLSDQHHSFAAYRTRLAAPKEASALPLRRLVLSDADAPQICQAVFDAVMKNGASAHGVASVIALAATDLLQRVSDDNRDVFVTMAHSLLYTAATHVVYSQVQEIESLPLLLTSACYLNAFNKEQGQQQQGAAQPPSRAQVLGGGLIAPAILETLGQQLDAQDLAGAFSTARRYIQLGHDTRAMYAVIARAAARSDAAADAGHTLQIVQAAGEEYMNWPTQLRDTNIEGFLHVALRAAALAPRNTLTDNL